MVIDIKTLLKDAPILMGVVNVTPDSFSDGGEFLDPQNAIDHAMILLAEGAHILDIGGESTRPNSKVISSAEEQDRILPVIEGVKKLRPDAIISVDTRNADTMQAALDVGADIVNDISGLSHDSNSIDVVKQAQCPVILMHMQGTPQTMQVKPGYDDVVEDVYNYLDKSVRNCVDNGIKKENIILDVGIGFGKSLAHNLTLLNKLQHFHTIGCPLLLGTSRKSFIEKICADTPADQRLGGSIASALYGLKAGVQLYRVHDVKQTKQAFDVWKAVENC